METIRLVFGVLCLMHPLFPGVGLSLFVSVLGLGLIASGFIAGLDSDEANDLDFSS